MATKKSEVWKLFIQTGDTKVKCNLCASVLTYKGGSTSAMKNHLKNVHKKVNLVTTSESYLKQSTLSLTSKSKSTLGKDKWLAITRALALACAVDLRPVSMVMGKGFRNFCSLLNPAYQVPHYNTVTKHLLHLYEDQKKDLIDLLLGNKVSFTTDCWTSTGSRAYITLTAHFIDKDWGYKSVVIATRPLDESHTAANIASTIEKISDEFKIDQVAGLTTDNARNVTNSAAILNVIHVPCFAHTLQLAIDSGIGVPNVKKATSQASTLVGHFSKSAKATHALKQLQDEKPLALVQAVSTRWNSIFFMAERLLKLRIPVLSVLLDKDITKPNMRRDLDLSDQQWSVLEDIVPILRYNSKFYDSD